jgi:hypothetical protein
MPTGVFSGKQLRKPTTVTAMLGNRIKHRFYTMRTIEIPPDVRTIAGSPAGRRELLAAIGRAGRGEARFQFNGRTYKVEPSFNGHAIEYLEELKRKTEHDPKRIK